MSSVMERRMISFSQNIYVDGNGLKEKEPDLGLCFDKLCYLVRPLTEHYFSTGSTQGQNDMSMKKPVNLFIY